MKYFLNEKFFYAGKLGKQKIRSSLTVCGCCAFDKECTPFNHLPFCSLETYIKEI